MDRSVPADAAADVSALAAAHRPASHPLRSVIPEAAAARLTTYLHVLIDWVDRELSGPDERATISSETLASCAGVNPAKLRKDLSYIGPHGIRGVGYDVATLRAALEYELGALDQYPVAIVGVGHLGSALAGYQGFGGQGFPIRVLMDHDPAVVGTTVAGIRVADIGEAVTVCRESDITIGVIATPPTVAQQVADVLLAAGVRSILNFSPGTLEVPDDVQVRQVDLALQLHMLAFHESRRGRPLSDREALPQ